MCLFAIFFLFFFSDQSNLLFQRLQQRNKFQTTLEFIEASRDLDHL